MPHAIILISCPDSRGITASVTNFVYQQNGNIIHADQHIDEQSNTFFMRIEWSLEAFKLKRGEIESTFSPIAKKFKMHWQLYFTDQPIRTAVFVSKHLHCLYDLLYRHKSGQLPCEISVVVSNHPDGKKVAADFGIDYVEIPVKPNDKSGLEKEQIKTLEKKSIDFIILARYHQILSAPFVAKYENRIINIHHSFLPAFAGRDPYAQAYQKGVKIIGATSHYVTAELDQGPIIEQDTVRVSHRDSLEDLKRKGEDLEKVVLSRAVRWHLERKILCYNNKTVVFD